jgi:hypothetical protein
MKRSVGVLMVAALVSGCATTPQRAVGQLDQADARYYSEECIRARHQALHFDDNRIYTRIGTGLAASLLGPFGLPLTIGADVYQNDQRKQMNGELARQCNSTPGGVIPASTAPTTSPVATAAKPPAPASANKSCGSIRAGDDPGALTCD